MKSQKVPHPWMTTPWNRLEGAATGGQKGGNEPSCY